MKELTNKIKVLFVLICVAPVLAPVARSADITFNSNVDIASNLVVSGTFTVTNNVNIISNVVLNGSLSVTKIVPSQADKSISISGAYSDGATNAGGVTISGGNGQVYTPGGTVVIQGGSGGYETTGGDVVVQGGGSGFEGTAGNVILKNQSPVNGGGEIFGNAGYVKFQTGDGTTRFWLQSDGTLNGNGNGIINVNYGTLSVSNIMPSQANSSISISGANASGTPNGYEGGSGGGVLISGGTGAYETRAGNVVLQGGAGVYSSYAGSVILQGGSAGFGAGAGDVILKNQDNSFFGYPSGYVKLQTSDGTTRFWLQSDGTLNANGNVIANARVLPQGDLTMGNFTNSPPQ